MAKFWCQEDGADEWVELTDDCYDAEDAAENYAEELEPYSEGAQTFTIHVRWLDGKTETYEVDVEYEPVFRAHKREPRDGEEIT